MMKKENHSCNVGNIDGNLLIATTISTSFFNSNTNDINYFYHIDIINCKNNECIQSLSLENIIENNKDKIEFIIKYCNKTSNFLLITNIGIIYIFSRDLNLSIIPHWKYNYSIDIFNNNRYDGCSKNNIFDMNIVECYSFNYPFLAFHELNRNNSIEIFNISTNLITSIAPTLLSDRIKSCQISSCSNYIAIINESIDDIKNYNENNEEIKINNNILETSLYILDTEQLVMYNENNSSSYDNTFSHIESINDVDDESVDIVEKQLDIHLILDCDIITNIKLKTIKQQLLNINSFSINWKDCSKDQIKSKALLLTCDSFGGKVQIWSISKGVKNQGGHNVKDLIRKEVTKDESVRITSTTNVINNGIASTTNIINNGIEKRSDSVIASEIAVAAIKQAGDVDNDRSQSLGK
jgi:hypothetical protein